MTIDPREATIVRGSSSAVIVDRFAIGRAACSLPGQGSQSILADTSLADAQKWRLPNARPDPVLR